MEEIKIFYPKQFQKGVFSNLAKVEPSKGKIVISFAFKEPESNEGIMVSRVVLTKKHAMDLNAVLGKTLAKA